MAFQLSCQWCPSHEPNIVESHPEIFRLIPISFEELTNTAYHHLTASRLLEISCKELCMSQLHEQVILYTVLAIKIHTTLGKSLAITADNFLDIS